MLYPRHDETLQARPHPTIPVPVLLTVQQFVDKHPAWTVGSIRQLIFATKTRKTSRGPMPGNGLAPAIIGSLVICVAGYQRVCS